MTEGRRVGIHLLEKMVDTAVYLVLLCTAVYQYDANINYHVLLIGSPNVNPNARDRLFITPQVALICNP